MMRRFVSGSAVASLVIPCAALVVLLVPGLGERSYPLAFLWCFAPLGWGIWAVLLPSKWVPQRLPIWGAILGLIVASVAAFVLDLPSRILGQEVAFVLRAVGVIGAAVIYYFLWMLVRITYRSLAVPTPEAEKPVVAKAA